LRHLQKVFQPSVVVVLVELMLLHDVTRRLLVQEGVMPPDGDWTAMPLNFTEVVLGSLLQALA
jgi:hypothetical protein